MLGELLFLCEEYVFIYITIEILFMKDIFLFEWEFAGDGSTVLQDYSFCLLLIYFKLVNCPQG